MQIHAPQIGPFRYMHDTPLRHKVGHIARGTLPMMTMTKKISQTRAQYLIDSCQHACERTI